MELLSHKFLSYEEIIFLNEERLFLILYRIRKRKKVLKGSSYEFDNFTNNLKWIENKSVENIVITILKDYILFYVDNTGFYEDISD